MARLFGRVFETTAARLAGPAAACCILGIQQQKSLQYVECGSRLAISDDELEFTETHDRLHGSIRVHKLLKLSELGFKNAEKKNTFNKDGQVVSRTGQTYSRFIGEDDCVLVNIVRTPSTKADEPEIAYHRAGPREDLHFDPKDVRAAIVNCGGLCPGLNDVIHHIVEQLTNVYGVETIYGIRGGYRGFDSNQAPVNPSGNEFSDGPGDILKRYFSRRSKDDNSGKDGSHFFAPVILTPKLVSNWHHEGGTNLGSARGGFDEEKIISFLKKNKINQLYIIGGDGTHRGAYKLAKSCAEHGLNIAVNGVPKTIDNDIALIDYSFGFRSAVQAAQIALDSAVTEARGNMPNGIGVVKLMGRSSGYIASYATITNGSVDLCLIPEVPVVLHGPNGCLPHLERVIAQKGYATVVVAEGAGEELLGESAELDAGGNKKLPAIGKYMVDAIKKHFKDLGTEASVKYIDPSYTIRSVPANSDDSYLCHALASGVVHGAMAGFTGFTVGMVNNHSVLIPIPALVAKSPRQLNSRGRTWDRVLSITGQPNSVPAIATK
jgi:6-phosphofructokinase 1